eukprot:CAMPEP_0196995246 /NCGR_PEP_ID=MMETSP1380-20130617/1401_1 /TAXON_ID=5936 /ORGANISM="Euplotes crassus, Strain CT5" /LENGTH=65 /DNA_ID=CAMNT_0042410867 /DNA_START=39 /DNA_END=236 /DNA_ORIENTATION=-
MENKRQPTRKAKSMDTKVLSVMKKLNAFTLDDLETATPLKVTYIANKKARIVKYNDDRSTADESQ